MTVGPENKSAEREVANDQPPGPDTHGEDHAVPAERDHPDVPILPPVLFGCTLLFSLLFEVVGGGDFFRFGAQLTIGLLTISFGAGLMAWCLTLFAHEGTNIEPYKPTTTLVTVGPFAFSRNPIYIALSALYLGLCILFDITWGFVFFPPLIVALHFLVIVREEAYLEDKFGQAYRDYCASVRRWL
ncbi:MAG: isoprenylcysteine carboxylmethyltransferase family protein [Alphaproteobacteria bacterium]|nr:isoprenylcysteine carboxylmethyltransferase family protein [Alphaproteobacteria bacterium]MCB9974193.1 isoprenylcysteine carboxylmethyltransferase family protein [Rhodospirillales bacterium]